MLPRYVQHASSGRSAVMSNTEPLICVHRACDPVAYQAGCAFIEETYRKTLCIVPTPPDHLFIAYAGERIAGTLGIMTGRSEELRLPRLYEVRLDALPMPVELTDTVEFGRWISGSRQVSAFLILSAVRFARAIGKKYVWCEHSIRVHRAARRFGIAFYPVAAQARARLIEPRYRAYYAGHSPSLFLFELAQAEPAVLQYVAAHFPCSR